MIIHSDLEQGTEAWLNIRKGRITASEIGQFALKGTTKTARNARSALYAKKIAERSGADMLEQWDSKAMQRGKELEPEAREMFMFVTGIDVEEVGFVEHDNGLCGASPDGIVRDNFGGIAMGLECKSHLPEKHALYLLDPDAFEEAHSLQLHWQMAIMECDEVHLWGYCPRLPYIHRIVKSGDLTLKMMDAINELSEEYDAAIQQYNEIFAQQREQFAKLREEAAA